MRARPFVPKMQEVKSTHTTIGNEAFLTCLQNSKTAKPNRSDRKQSRKTTTTGSPITQDKTTQRHLLEQEQHMTQFCSPETQSSVQEGSCQSESTSPRNQKPSLTRRPRGHESSWRIYSRLPISLRQTAHLPMSDFTLNITQPRKTHPLCFLSGTELQLGFK